MINILHCIDSVETGGAELIFLQLADSLRNDQHQSFVVVTGEGWLTDRLREHGIEPYILNAKGKFNIIYLAKLIYLAYKHKIDIIQSHLFGSNVYCSLAGLICNKATISTFHGNVDVNPNDRLNNIKFRILNAGSKKIICVSDQLRKIFSTSTAISPEKHQTIYNGVSLETFKPNRNSQLRDELNLSDDDIIISSIGDTRAVKGYKDLLQAASTLIKQSKRYHFIIAGSTTDPTFLELQALKTQLELDEHIHFIGFRKDVAHILNNSDLFLLSSISEGFSIATIEAMACGVPVIATRSGGPEEIIEHEHTGLLVDVNSPEQISLCIEKLTHDKALRDHLVSNALQHVTNKFSLNAMLKNYTALYEELIKPKRSR